VVQEHWNPHHIKKTAGGHSRPKKTTIMPRNGLMTVGLVQYANGPPSKENSLFYLKHHIKPTAGNEKTVVTRSSDEAILEVGKGQLKAGRLRKFSAILRRKRGPEDLRRAKGNIRGSTS